MWLVFTEDFLSELWFQFDAGRSFPQRSPSLWPRCLQVAWMWSSLWWFPVIPQVSESRSQRFLSVTVCLSSFWVDCMFRDPWQRRRAAGAAGCYSWVWVGPLLKRALWWGLLLGTAWASNSCDKCSSHGDGGRFSQTNNGRMFICGSSLSGSPACLPLSLDGGTLSSSSVFFSFRCQILLHSFLLLYVFEVPLLSLPRAKEDDSDFTCVCVFVCFLN